MRVYEGTAEGFVNAFHTKQDQDDIALLILSDHRAHIPVLQAAIEGRTQLDAALGERIGLFLFGEPGEKIVSSKPGSAAVISGRRLTFGPAPTAREFFNALPQAAHVDSVARERILAMSTVDMVPALAVELGVGEDQLPCVCALIRGAGDVLTTPVGSRLSFDTLVRAAKAVRREIESLEAELAAHLRPAPLRAADLAKIEALIARRDAARDLILDYARALESRFRITLAPQLKGLFARRAITFEAFADLVRDQSKTAFAELAPTRRWRTTQRHITDWLALQSRIETALQGASIDREMDRQDYLAKYEGHVRRAITTAMSESGLSMTRYSGFVPAAVKVAPAIAAGVKLIDILRRAMAP